MFRTKAGVQLAAVTVALLGSATALGEVVVQTLDSVKVHSDTAVLNMNFDDPLEPDFTNSLINGTLYRACKHTGFGLYCLDGDLVKRTPNIGNPGTTFTAIDCKDQGLNLDTNKGTPCTALTVDLTGTVWLGGKNKGKSHSLFKAVPNPNPLIACPSGVGIQGNTYCATEVATGRPLLVDLSSVDGDSATTFVLGAGILGLEERKTAVFFPSIGGVPIVIASGKSGWNLVGNEQLISAAAIQVEDINENLVSYVLVTTTKNRVLAKRADGTGAAIPVFDIAANRGASPPALCPAGDIQYGIRSSGKTGAIYLTDKQYCTVKALQANPQPDGSLPANSLTVIDTLSTIDTVEGTHAPVAPTVAPGIGIDLTNCSFDQNGNPIICTLVVDAQGAPAATLKGVRLASAESGLTLYQVKNIPDCRYDPQTCVELLDDVSAIPDLFPDVIWDPYCTINQAFFVDVMSAGNPIDVNLSQKLAITPDETYTLTFRARSNVNRTIVAGIGLSGGSLAKAVQTVSLTTECQTFTLDLTATGFGDADSRVLFDLGAEVGEVYIDHVSLVVATGGGGLGPELLTNGDFEAGTSPWLAGVTIPIDASNVIDAGTGDPAVQLLNFTKLLPKEITDQFLLSGGLPKMWLPRQYRGQKSNGFVFEAFFGVTEEGVIFRDTFEGVFKVASLVDPNEPDDPLRCVPSDPGTLPSPTALSTLLAWDVLNTVSEEFPTFDDPFLPTHPPSAPQNPPGEDVEHVSTIINSGCGSSKSVDVRWSLKPYNLEITPCTYNPNPNDVWASDGSCPVGGPEVIDDAVFAKLLLSLFDDWKLALDQLACADADGAGSPPIGDCSTLVANWFNAKDKLDKCWDATQKPKQSAGAQNCTAFVSQLNGLETALNSVVAPPPPLDPANRIGELKSRLKVIRHIRQDRFTPSIPADGFVEPQP